MDIDDIFMKSYFNEYTEREKKKIFLSQEDRLIASKKKDQLKLIEQFLQKFVDLEILVNHCDQYTKNNRTMEGIEPQLFSFQLIDSSKTWAPGISILFNHPAEVEIAIPNNPTVEGLVVIKVASHHPDSYILEKKFTNYETACEALGRFLGKCTVSIGKKPEKIHVDLKKNNTAFLNNIPKEAPNNVENITSLKQINKLFIKDEE